MPAKPLALFFLGILLFMLLLYGGLNAAARGIQELLALEGPPQALAVEIRAGKPVIIFAGKEYVQKQE